MSFRPYNPDTDNLNNDGNDLEPPPDGTHTGCELLDAGAFTSKSKNEDWVKFQWRAPDGHTWTVLQGFRSDAQTAVTWSEVSKLGINPVDVPSLDDLNDRLINLVGAYYDLAVKTNGQFRNTYINGPTVGNNPVVQQNSILGQAQEPAAVGAGTQDDDDIPF